MNTHIAKPLIALFVVAALSTTTASAGHASGIIDTLTKGNRTSVVVKKVVPVKKVKPVKPVKPVKQIAAATK